VDTLEVGIILAATPDEAGQRAQAAAAEMSDRVAARDQAAAEMSDRVAARDQAAAAKTRDLVAARDQTAAAKTRDRVAARDQAAAAKTAQAPEQRDVETAASEENDPIEPILLLTCRGSKRSGSGRPCRTLAAVPGWGEKAQAFSWHQIGAEDDLLQLGLIQRTEVEVAGWVPSQPAVGILDRTFLLGGAQYGENDQHARFKLNSAYGPN
jgi:hypothetical protein